MRMSAPTACRNATPRKLKGYFRASLAFIILGITPVLNARAQEPACDFSGYRPSVIPRPPADALIKKVEAEYPSGTRMRLQGEVKVKILVDRKGNVVRACVTQGHPLFRQSAMKAAWQWKFKPDFGLSKRRGRRYIQSVIVFNFRLD